jgi:hypothetical protein
MATTIITGQDLTLTIESVAYSDQCSNATLALENDRQEFDVLSGTVYKTIKTTGTLSVELFQDWNATPSVCEALWNAAKTAPDTTLSATLVANTGVTFTFEVFPSFPDAGGTAPDALTASVELTIAEGSVTLA